MRSTVAALSVVLVVGVSAGPFAGADTVFRADSGDGFLVGSHLDPGGAPLLVSNPAEARQERLVEAQGLPPSWESRYSSITVNRFGRGLPTAGMNLRGLVVQLLWLEDADRAKPETAVAALQWVQYALDTFDRLDPAVASLSGLALGSEPPVQLFLCERSGACASVDFTGTEALVHARDTLPVPVLAGRPYRASIEALNRSLGYGGEPTEAAGGTGLDRFVRAINELRRNRPGPDEEPVAVVRRVLTKATGEPAGWHMIFDPKKLVVHVAPASVGATADLFLGVYNDPCAPQVRAARLATTADDELDLEFAPLAPEVNRRTAAAGAAATTCLPSATEKTWTEIAGAAAKVECAKALTGSADKLIIRD